MLYKSSIYRIDSDTLITIKRRETYTVIILDKGCVVSRGCCLYRPGSLIRDIIYISKRMLDSHIASGNYK